MKPTVRIGFTSVAAAAALVFLGGCAREIGAPQVGELPRDAHAVPSARDILDHPCENGDVAGCISVCKANNDAKSCNFAGTLLEFDREGRDDPTLASGFYRRACNAAYYPGCNNLAWLYVGGRGVPQDKAQAMRLFFYAYDASRIACLEGDLDGCVMAGELIEEGRGIDQDLEQALAFYDRACDGGQTRACERAAKRR
jgi:TPR repeat protein